jgi:hypothetical protein
MVLAHGLSAQAVFQFHGCHALSLFHGAKAAGGSLPPLGCGVVEMNEVGVYFLSPALVQPRDFFFQLKDAHNAN